MTVTITLPPPNAKLHAHAKGGWRAKSGPTNALRELANLATREHVKSSPWPRATILYRFWFKDAIHRDAANAIQSMKPAVDGVVDAGLIAGDNWQRLRIVGVECGIDRDDPRTELVFDQDIEQTMHARLDDERRVYVRGE